MRINTVLVTTSVVISLTKSVSQCVFLRTSTTHVGDYHYW